MWFEAMSDLRINLSKSEIIPVGPVDNVAELPMELDCGIGSFPSSYLGLPLGAQHKAIGFGIWLKKGSRRGWPHGRCSIFLRVEGTP